MSVIPVVRPGWAGAVSSYPVLCERVIEYDLVSGNEEIPFFDCADIDCIIHCAGVVHFTGAENKNQLMMAKVVNLAKQVNIPVYAVSTAFVYRPEDTVVVFNNSYEEDKYKAEQLLVSSGVEYSIIRPSVLTGSSVTGAIQNFSGYYHIVRAFLSAVSSASKEGRKLRFPRMKGVSDMVPVDRAAHAIGEIVETRRLSELLYVTNPHAPSGEWVLSETLSFFGIQDVVTMVDVSYEEFGTLDLTEEERSLYTFMSHFVPYWSVTHTFPESVCSDTEMITSDYLKHILTFFSHKENIEHHE